VSLGLASVVVSAQGEQPGLRPAQAPPSSQMPAALQKVAFEQRLNAQLPLDLPFTDETGAAVKLGDYFGRKPVVLAFVYYECPMLCTQVLNGIESALRVIHESAGKEFDVVTVSFDPRETPVLAAGKKKAYLDRYQRAGAEQGWHFLTGEAASINALTKAVGFKYQWDAQTQQFAHSTALMVLTPQGKIAQYFYGVEYSPKDLRLGMVEASQGRIGTPVDQILLYCYHYDPRTGRYGAIITRVLQIAGAITVLVLGGFILMMLKMEPKSHVKTVRARER
jgi:protein SCO1/2